MAQEDSPLRACVNGRIMSVVSDFCDFALRMNMPQGDFVAAELIGKTFAVL